ncbi:exodeoxyribonuclease III [Bacillus sp. TS-2]|nr:exodeoxyribonuclease III [Bacillus sp. TS-2]
MKLVSWNVNGIRACIKKGFLDYFYKVDADFFCIQETKCHENQIDLTLPEYEQFWNDSKRKGYSGTAIFTKRKPLSVAYGIGEGYIDEEGRVITLEYENFYLITCYTPNAKRDLSRLKDRLSWEDEFRLYASELNIKKPTIICGDLNVAHQEIDLKNDRSNRGNSGFTNEEREKLTLLLKTGFIDSFRYLYPLEDQQYTWWSYMNKVRERNIGWRIDYFLVSNSIKERMSDSMIDSKIIGSDHCPIKLTIDL